MKRFTVLMVAAFVIFSAQLFSQPEEMRAIHRFMGKLNLTEEQKKDAEKIGVDVAKQSVAQKAKLATAQIELQQLFKADNPEKAAIEKKLNEIANISVQSRMIKIDSWFAINKILTPEQQKTWKRVLENAPAIARQRMMKRMGERPMPFQRHEEKMPK